MDLELNREQESCDIVLSLIQTQSPMSKKNEKFLEITVGKIDNLIG